MPRINVIAQPYLRYGHLIKMYQSIESQLLWDRSIRNVPPQRYKGKVGILLLHQLLWFLAGIYFDPWALILQHRVRRFDPLGHRVGTQRYQRNEEISNHM